MDILKEFRDPKIANNLLNNITNKSNINISIMEVCGTHTNAILKSGIVELLPKNINLINGPGCPVCVTPQMYIDAAIELSKLDDVIITTFGDLIRVPGNYSSLGKEKSLGRDIRIVYSPLDSIKIAKENPNKEVVFLAIGFETTAPIIALSIYLANKDRLTNYSILNCLKTMPDAMKSLVLNPRVKIDGFLCPGHVATVIGEEPFLELVNEYKMPLVICGFEVNDILSAIYTLINMKENNDYKLYNLYGRLVENTGNEEAVKLINRVFTKSESFWRGLGKVSNTGFKLNSEYKNFDILLKRSIHIKETEEDKGCSCGEILIGIKKPNECKLFGRVCTPLNPIGACMVSEEGTCAAFYKYR